MDSPSLGYLSVKCPTSRILYYLFSPHQRANHLVLLLAVFLSVLAHRNYRIHEGQDGVCSVPSYMTSLVLDLV